MRDIVFQNGVYYHVYNRGASKRPFFQSKFDYQRFLTGLSYFNTENPIGSIHEHSFAIEKSLGSPASKLVDLCAFCLCPNHYHLLLRQIMDDGVSKYLHRLGTGYTKYYNYRYKHSGHIFQGNFKAKEVKNDNYLFWLSAYINGNAQIHDLADPGTWPWNSLEDYLHDKSKMINNKEILNLFQEAYPQDQYKDFVKQVIEDSKGRKKEFANLEY